MGLFRRTVSDVKELVEKADYAKALEVIEAHIENEHQLDGDISSLRRRLSSYEHELLTVRGLLRRNENASEVSVRDIQRMISNLESAEEDVREIKELIKKMKKEGKLVE